MEGVAGIRGPGGGGTRAGDEAIPGDGVVWLEALLTLHTWTGLALIAAGLFGWLWALSAGRRGRPLPDAFWRFARVALGGLFALQALVGIILFALGRRPVAMHWLYALLVLGAVGAAEALRPGSRLRANLAAQGGFDEGRVYAWVMLLLALLATRALMTGMLGF